MYVSPGRDDVCGLFIIGSVNQIVAIEFTGFNINCDEQGLLVVGVQSVVYYTVHVSKHRTSTINVT